MNFFSSSAIQIGRSARGSTPFYRLGRSIQFNHQGGRRLEYGVLFTPTRGYQAYFRFAESTAANAFQGESLKEWCLGLTPTDPVERALRIEGAKLADKVIQLQADWVNQGRPKNLFAVVGAP